MQNSTDRRYAASLETTGKNMLVAYLFWWFLGFVGAHRFYLDRPGSAVAMIVLFVLGFFTFAVTWVIEAVWWLIDGYFVYRFVCQANEASGQPSLGFALHTNASDTSGASKIDLELLEKAHTMREQGILTDDEYARKKQQVLGESIASGSEPNTAAVYNKKIDVLNQLTKLRNDGALTEEEFQDEKRKVLNS